MAYLKPQAPLMNGADYIYPITTADQIIKADGTRLDQNGVITVDQATNATNATEAAHAAEADNATTLNGKDAEYYATAESVDQLSDQIAEKYALKTELPSLKWVLVGKSYGEAVSVPECDEVMLYVTATDEATYAFNSVILPYFAFQDSYIPMRIFIRGGYATITCSNGKVTLAHVLLDGVDVTQTSIVNVYAR